MIDLKTVLPEDRVIFLVHYEDKKSKKWDFILVQGIDNAISVLKDMIDDGVNAYFGFTDVGGRGVMVDYRYFDGGGLTYL